MDQLSSVKLPLAVDDRVSWMERRPLFPVGHRGKNLLAGKRINSWKLFNAAVNWWLMA